MRILVACFSQTGNTDKVARAICKAAASQGHEVDACKVVEITFERMDDYDLVYLGSACHDSDLAKPAKRLLEGIGVAPPFRLAGFVTHATQMPEGGEREKELYARWAGNCIRTYERICQEKQIPFAGYFHCQGAPSPPIEAFIRKEIVTEEDEWNAYIEEVRPHPDDRDLEEARRFTLRVLDDCQASPKK
jgi:flavodoxin